MKNPSAAATWPGRSKDLGPVQEQVVGPRGGRPPAESTLHCHDLMVIATLW